MDFFHKKKSPDFLSQCHPLNIIKIEIHVSLLPLPRRETRRYTYYPSLFDPLFTYNAISYRGFDEKQHDVGQHVEKHEDDDFDSRGRSQFDTCDRVAFAHENQNVSISCLQQ